MFIDMLNLPNMQHYNLTSLYTGTTMSDQRAMNHEFYQFVLLNVINSP